ncbi:MAG: phosphoribosylamine--glycine ligase [Spirochaetia bacterium]
MKVLVVGGGAREHTVCWKFSRSNRLSGLFVAPGNAGTADLATNLSEIDANDVEAITRFSVDSSIDLVFVGPEAPLATGLVDALLAEGIAAIGPHAAASKLEASKKFAKSFMTSNNIPTAAYRSFFDADEFEKYVRGAGKRLVVKKSGLAAGKGVFEDEDPDVLITKGRAVVEAGDEVVAEEYLTGSEVSLFALTDGSDYLILPLCADYKKAGPGGTGPNTGGMGAICPVPWVTDEETEQIDREIVAPTFRGMADAGIGYRGVLYFGLMMTIEGPRLLEYNVRFGDPEAQVLLPLLRADFTNWCEAIAHGSIAGFPTACLEASAVGVVIAAAGYPGSYEKRLTVSRLPSLPEDEALVFHASTAMQDGRLVTGGGRCFTAVGIGRELLDARSRAYSAARGVTFPGSWYRPDIGARVFGS